MSSFIGFIIGVAIIIVVCNWDATCETVGGVISDYPLAFTAVGFIVVGLFIRRAR